MQYSRGWGAARVLEGVAPQKKEGISLKNGAQKLVSKRYLPKRKRYVPKSKRHLPKSKR